MHKLYKTLSKTSIIIQKPVVFKILFCYNYINLKEKLFELAKDVVTDRM